MFIEIKTIEDVVLLVNVSKIMFILQHDIKEMDVITLGTEIQFKDGVIYTREKYNDVKKKINDASKKYAAAAND